jgi:hypothetical protein
MYELFRVCVGAGELDFTDLPAAKVGGTRAVCARTAKGCAGFCEAVFC